MNIQDKQNYLKFKKHYYNELVGQIEPYLIQETKLFKNIKKHFIIHSSIALIIFLISICLTIYTFKNIYTFEPVYTCIDTALFACAIIIETCALNYFCNGRKTFRKNIIKKFENEITKNFINPKSPFKISKKCLYQSQLFDKNMIILQNNTYQHNTLNFYTSVLLFWFFKFGLAIKIKSNKIIKNKIIITQKSNNNSHIQMKHLTPINSENIKFLNNHNIYSIKPNIGLEIITEELIKDIENIQHIFGAKHIKTSIFGDNLLIFISDKTNLYRTNNLLCIKKFADEINCFLDKIYSIIELANYLKT